MDYGFQACNSILLLVELGFRIPIFSEIKDSLSCIPDSKAHGSGFHKQNFPVFRIPNAKFLGIRNPYSLGLTRSWSYITLVFVLYIKFWQKIGFFQTLLVGLYCHQKPEFWFELTTSNHFNSQRDKINALKEYKFSSTLLTLCFVHLIFPKISCPGV